MISFKIGMFRKEIWFKRKPYFTDIFSLNLFQQSSCNKKLFGFRREDYFTKIIDLRQTEESIFGSFSKTTRNEISRARRENVEFKIENDVDSFIAFYNQFARTKGQQLITNKTYFQQPDCFRITKAMLENETLVMHFYLMDKTNKLVRIYQGASHFREREDRNLIGRANRFLHYQDMLHFKNEGFTVYDFGGYGENSNDEEVLKINAFKDHFGGVVVRQSNYTPYFLIFIKRIQRFKDQFRLISLFSGKLRPRLLEGMR